jgi:hypothetical protein
MCIYVYMYICINVYMYICTCIHVPVYMYIWMYVYMYVYIDIWGLKKCKQFMSGATVDIFPESRRSVNSSFPGSGSPRSRPNLIDLPLINHTS